MTGLAAKAAAPRHLYKRVDAVGHAETAAWHLRRALQELCSAERSSEACGYRGARVGIRQAAARVLDWGVKLEAEISAARAAANQPAGAKSRRRR